MDHIRKELDQLMGKDRNKPLHHKEDRQEHFSDPDVCKFYLVAFCPHDLFPNTKADMGKCPKKHDDYYRKMFQADPNKEVYQRRYEEELMEVLERIISQLDTKIRKTLSKIEVPADSDKPKELHERIDGLNKKINFFLEQADKLGEEGRLDESEAIMKEIERLKIQRSELSNMSENPLMQNEKQMHICEVCGAMQSLTDTDKRLTIHLEGKLHSGYALIRKTLVEIKQRRDEYRKLKEKEAENKVQEAKEKTARERENPNEENKDKGKAEKEKNFFEDRPEIKEVIKPKQSYNESWRRNRNYRKSHSRSRDREDNYKRDQRSQFSRDEHKDNGRNYDKNRYDSRDHRHDSDKNYHNRDRDYKDRSKYDKERKY